MEHTAGESDDGSLRVDFDRRLKLQFHGSRITSDAGLLAYHELDNAVTWTRLSCQRFAACVVRLQLRALAYNLATFLRSLALPDEVKQWSMTTLRDRMVKIGAKIVRHGRSITFQMGEVMVPRALFAGILTRIARLRVPPAPA